MKRHPFDPFAFVAGSLFVGLGIWFLAAGSDVLAGGEPCLDGAPVEAAVPSDGDRRQRIALAPGVLVDARSWDREQFGDVLGCEERFVQRQACRCGHAR